MMNTCNLPQELPAPVQAAVGVVWYRTVKAGNWVERVTVDDTTYKIVGIKLNCNRIQIDIVNKTASQEETE